MNALWLSSALVLLMFPLVTRAQTSAPGRVSVGGATPVTDTPTPLTIYKAGGDVRPPRLVNKVSENFTENAHNQKIPGNIVISLYVDLQGMPRDIRVVRGVGHGMDEQAVATVQQYRFKPGTKNGEPVAVQILANFKWN